MPILVRGDDVCIVTLDGSTLWLREGKRGTVGTTKHETFPSEHIAQQTLTKMVLLQKKRGFVDDASGEVLLLTEAEHAEIEGAKAVAAPRNAELEARLLADPRDRDAHLVYADWLQSKGDLRGELIAVQCAIEEKSSPALVKREAEILNGSRTALLGRLGAFAKTRKDYDSHGHLDVTWKRGFVNEARLGFATDGEGDGDPSGEDPDPQRNIARGLALLFELPSAILLERLVLGPMPLDRDYLMNFQPAIDALVKGPRPATLRSLELGDIAHWDISSTVVGDASKLWGAIPALREVTFHGGSVTLGEIAAPELRAFAMRTTCRPHSVASIEKARWPKLERLEVWFGSPEYGAQYGGDSMLAVMRATPASVVHLGLCNSLFTDEILPDLARWKGLKSLRTLDLSLGCLSDRGAASLVEHAKAFAHLETLDLDRNCMTEDGMSAVSKALPKAVFGEQDPDRFENEDDRYVAVAE